MLMLSSTTLLVAANILSYDHNFRLQAAIPKVVRRRALYIVRSYKRLIHVCMTVDVDL